LRRALDRRRVEVEVEPPALPRDHGVGVIAAQRAVVSLESVGEERVGLLDRPAVP
jgi:hypothetical protein